MASMATAPEELSQTSTLTMPLRTYSRRSLNRRHTSSPNSDAERTIRRTRSYSAVTSQATVTIQTIPTQFTANTGRGRSRLSGPTKEAKTPNDLAWEALTLSAPFLTQPFEEAADELHSDEQAKNRQLDTDEAIDDRTDGKDDFDPIEEDQILHEDASQHEAPEGISSEDSDGGNGKKECQLKTYKG